MVVLYEVIETQTHLDRAVEGLSTQNMVALDTEFERTNTYWPKLALIQLCWDNKAILVDPLKTHLCFQDFIEVLKAPSLVKVLHSPYEDLEVLLPFLGAYLPSIVDTQLASVFCGWGDGLGYGRLVDSFMGIQLSKACQWGKWLRRPLSSLQLEYAASDVLYLIPIFKKLEEQLRCLGRYNWFQEEMPLQFGENFLQDKKRRLPKLLPFKEKDPIKKQRLCEIGLEACLWRDEEAQRRNRPRKWVMSDSEIICLVENRHLDSSRLGKNTQLKRLANSGELKKFHETFRNFAGHPLPPTADLTSLDELKLETLKTFLCKESQEMKLPPSLIAKPEHLMELIRTPQPLQIPKLLKGWRKEAFGDKALHFLAREDLSLPLENRTDPYAF